MIKITNDKPFNIEVQIFNQSETGWQFSSSTKVESGRTLTVNVSDTQYVKVVKQ